MIWSLPSWALKKENERDKKEERERERVREPPK